MTRVSLPFSTLSGELSGFDRILKFLRLGGGPGAGRRPSGRPAGFSRGHIALVGAGPGARDLLTLRAVDRLQQADVVFYDRLVDPEVLELIPRGAERVYVGKVVGAHAWPQPRINNAIVAAALRGQRVVRLKSGDPGVFGRAAEEIAAAHAAGIAVELVPGVTAAFATAAHAGMSLTERGVSDTLVLTTGMSRAGDPLPDSLRHAGPGTTLALYMAVGQAARLRDGLIAAGLPADAPVRIGVEVSKPTERQLTCPLGVLPETLAQDGVRGIATILVVWPKSGTGPVPQTALGGAAERQPA
ncbi:uroporphyrinogen-III C-methyltransferase [Pseudodonghicola flavimaris]|uniref:uroporphyrinogen-III C-methyltransferase n=1 Tax=Pseudodonghicola flavimaris TaxID=3050036 RepID=A0ABT7EZM5_9RHOB|nr:uroporphyrinogen-III C-methyltransferase [Pseudodonghicola flavimaris]MDK3017792.1 uroporphyrinogen-III C-methyltransferase [Pseudodonghicola flavimaris]